ncbi:tRNA-dihydrouridine(16/17) synthase [NAD(P)(+)]-like isoform X2 [Achroia grisella]|uniref:tRNA-dihydrouridine(16/17) synthase [NAD(P)(+)]-like isoform X2 n=1 Tax=Achroia grisella TaxID=688607 RepID=UPI0027D329B5|nr:tRNA-dihydrouridine(16/17) synthase [NAD(P)(+)]-like isoform X2 [Achroia grisella]
MSYEWFEQLGQPRFVVAPMVDASELAWRLLCRRHGAQLCYSPMFHSNVFIKDPKYRKDSLQTCEEDRPLIVQFCGNKPEVMAAAAKLAEQYCDAIDVNLGCPQAIAKRGRYGSYLQDDWELLQSIVSAMSKAVSIPITCKVRIFEDVDKSVKYALMLQEAGCKLLTVHGRTREQKGPLTGVASWKHIKAVSFIVEDNNEVRQLLATAQNINHFRQVCFAIKERYLHYHQGLKHFNNDESIIKLGYNLLLPPWICQPYVRMSPEEHTMKMERHNKDQGENIHKRIHEDPDGNTISRKKMKKLRRIMRRPIKAENQTGRSGEICMKEDCLNPLGGKCVYQLCKKCCKSKCYEENLDCQGHRILVHTKRQLAKNRAIENDNKT